ncbi:MAG: Eco57I restriction-modification methylase domain-containing protein [Promethearchaeota archaeon]
MNSQKIGRVYTPENLTNYIAQITIDKFLVTKINKRFSTNKISIDELFEKYIRKENDNRGSLVYTIDKIDREQFEYVFEVLRDLKVLDPAVGSGHLLIAALKVIEKYMVNLRSLGIINWTNLKIKKEIISRNLFGVDIEKDAIENTKKRLLATIKHLVHNEKDNDKQNIHFNLKLGNAVIGYINKSEITSLNHKDLNACFYDEIKYLFHTHKDLKKLDLTEREEKTMLYTLKPFHWFYEFPKIMERGGFDIIIENPPYISNKNLSPLEKAIFQERYKTTKGLMNTFGIFIERSINICNLFSINCFVIHKNIIRSNNYDLLRKFLLEHTTIEEIIDVGAGAFPSITAEAVIILIKNTLPIKTHKIKIKTNFNKQNIITSKDILIKELPQNIYLKQENYNFNLELLHDELEIINYIRNNKDFILNDYFEAKTCIATGNDTKFLKDHKVSEKFKKTLRGKNIGRYFIDFNGLYVNYDPKALHRARDESIFQKPEKLIMQTISSNLTVAYDNMKYYPLSTCIAIIPKENLDDKFSIKYLLLLMNSKVMNFYYDSVFNLGAHLTTEISVNNINRLPLKFLEEYDVFNKLADIMIHINENEIIRDENKNIIEYFNKLINLLISEIIFSRKLKSDGLNTELINRVSLYLKNLKQLSFERLDLFIKNLRSDEDINNEVENINNHPWIIKIEKYFEK